MVYGHLAKLFDVTKEEILRKIWSHNEAGKGENLVKYLIKQNWLSSLSNITSSEFPKMAIYFTNIILVEM